MNKRSKFSDINFSNKVVELYKEGYKSKEISKLVGISKTTLIRNLNLLGYNFDKSVSMQKYSLDKDYFENINSDSKAYWLGLIYADGSNKVSKNTFVLGLKEDDCYILELLKKDLNYNNKLKLQIDPKGIKKDFYRLEIYNKKVCYDLLNLGVFENKTSILQKPTLNSKFIYHFIRGYFDGDGGIYTHIDKNNNSRYKDSINFTGTKEITDFIKGIIKVDLNINCSVYQRHPERDNNNYTITVNGRLNVIKLCEKMYKNKDKHFFNRKFNQFKKIKNRYE